MEKWKDFGRLETVVPQLAGEGWRKWVRRRLEAVMGLDALQELVANIQADKCPNTNPFGVMRECVRMEVTGQGLDIPAEGGVLVLANHSLGAADAMAMGDLCCRTRKDVKIFSNEEVAKIPKFRPFLLALDILSKKGIKQKNRRALLEGIRHLESGGLLGLFPAGEVARWHWRKGRVHEGEWSELVETLIKRANPRVVLMSFSDRNPWWYYVAGVLSPTLRTVLIPKALFARHGKTMQVKLELIEPDNLPEKEIIRRLRKRVLAMRT